MDRSGAEHLRKTVTGVCMILGPVAILASDLTWPVKHTKAAAIMRDVAGLSGRTYASTLLAILSACLFAGAVLGLAHMLHEQRPAMAITGGALALIGSIALAAIVAAQGVLLSVVAQSKFDQAAMTPVVKDVFSRSMPIGFLVMMTGVGLLVLVVGLYQARAVPVWSAAALALGIVGVNIGAPIAVKAVIYASEVLMLVGFGSIGYEVLTETDEAWEHTREFQGFARPMTA